MKPIILVAETGSDLSPEVAAQYNIQLAPMHVAFDQTTLDDGSFPAQDIIDYYQTTGKLPKTSGCTPEDFVKVFDEIHEKWPDAHILYLAYSAVTTCSYQSAMIAAEDRDYVTAIDTQHVSAGQFCIVETMGKRLQENPDMTLEQAVEESKALAARARMCFLPDNLEFLRAGGRVSNVVALGSRILSLHPCIEILDGKLTATKKFRGKMVKVAAQLIEHYAEYYDMDRERIWIVYTPGMTDEVKQTIVDTAKKCGFADLTWVPAHGVITTHAGPAAFGLAGFAKA